MKRILTVLLPALCLLGMTFLPGLRSSANEDNPLPKVVARLDQHFRAADLPTTITLYTPEESGLFRINGYAVVTNSDPSGAFVGYFTFGWTDNVSTKPPQQVLANAGNFGLPPFGPPAFGLAYFGPGAYDSTSFIVREAGSTPITFSAANTIVPGIPGNNEFTVFFTIEKLSN
jgi:hypothetical protein